MKSLIENRNVFWRAAVFGGAVSAMFLAGCANGSRGLFSRSLRKFDEQKVSRHAPERDPFLAIENEQPATSNAGRQAGNPRLRRWENDDSTRRFRGSAVAGRSGLSARFDRNRVTTTTAAGTRRFSDPASRRSPGGDPFLALERSHAPLPQRRDSAMNFTANRRGTVRQIQRDNPPHWNLDRRSRNSIETVATSRRVSQAASRSNRDVALTGAAPPFPGEPGTGSGGRSEQGRVQPATLAHAGDETGSMIASPPSPQYRRSALPVIQPGPIATASTRRKPTELRIIPRNAGALPQDRMRSADLASPSDDSVVQTSAMRDAAGDVERQSPSKLEWRALPPIVDRPLPAPTSAKRALSEAPPAPVEPTAPLPTARPENASTAPLPFPAEAANGPVAATSAKPVADADAPSEGAVAVQPTDAESRPVNVFGWVLFGLLAVAAVFLFLRRRRLTTPAT